MDISSLVGTLMSSDSVSNLGKTTKTDNGTVKNVLSAALPSLLSGAKEQSEDSSSGFADALQSHGKKDTSNLASFLGGVDMADGGKIVGHLLGGKSDDEISGIAKKAGASKKDTSNILSAAAPLLMSLLGQQSSSSSSSSSGNSALGGIASTILQNVDVSDLLGNLLGVGSNESSSTTSTGKKKKKTSSSSSSSSGKKKTSSSSSSSGKKKTSSSSSSSAKKKTSSTSSAKKKTSASAKKEENSALGAVGDILGSLLK